MKRTTIFCLMTLIISTCAWSQSRMGSSYRTLSYYGFSGLTFIPTTQVIGPKEYSFSYSSRPVFGKNVTLIPYSVRLAQNIGNVELAVTNTPFYASERSFGGVDPKTIIAPLVPSIKYQFMPMSADNNYVSMAAGVAMPYGGYYAVDKLIRSNLFDMTVHTGIGTKLTTYHAFAGLTLTFGNRVGDTQRDLPLEIMAESAWGGSLKELTKKEEGFVAFTVRKAWTSKLFIVTFMRMDAQRLAKDPSQKSPKQVGIGLDFTI